MAFLLLAACALMVYALWQRPAQGTEVAFTPTAHFDTCYKQVSQNKLAARRLKLAGEAVPLHRAAVRRRLERELDRYTDASPQTRALTARARRYFRVIDPILKRNDVPRDFRYVVAVESAFEDGAVSRRGATGIWQLMQTPAQEVGLTINNEVDERLHIEKATEAACRYLKFLKKETGTWTGALAAYNCGLARYNRAAARVGSRNYYKMAVCKETSRYVYKVLAIKELVERPQAYGLTPAPRVAGFPDSRRIRVKEPIEDLGAFAARHNTDMGTLRELNPWLVGHTLTPEDGKACFVLVSPRPTERIAAVRRMAADSAAKAAIALRIDSIAFALPERM